MRSIHRRFLVASANFEDEFLAAEDDLGLHRGVAHAVLANL